MSNHEYKVIISGPRHCHNQTLVDHCLDGMFSRLDKSDILIIHGDARGIDTCADNYARERKIDRDPHPADWDTHPRAAGHIRNREMSKLATHLIAFWDGESSGTKGMIDVAHKQGLIVVVFNLRGEPIYEECTTRRNGESS